MKRTLLILFAICLATPALCNSIIVELENDIFTGSDKRYTHGTRITYEHNDLYWSIGQNIYTPEDITLEVPAVDDRPYAGVLYLSLHGTKFTEDGRTTSGYSKRFHQLNVSIGIVGDYSLADKTQIFVHSLIDSREPKGWDYQVDDMFLLQADFKLHEDMLRTRYFNSTIYMAGEIGTIKSYTGIGGTLLAGYNIPRIINQPIASKVSDYSLFVFTDLLGKNVFYNHLLESDHTDIIREEMVLEARGGVGIAYKYLEFRFTYTYRSEEFKEQNSPTEFGGLFFKYSL